MSATDPLIGRVLDGKYRVDALLGVGGMGAVYRAVQLGLERRVAVKLMREDFASDRTALKRFEREARTLARLKHPNIVTIYDFGVAPGAGVYLAMEFLDGRSLRQELRRRLRLSVGEAVALTAPVCSALGQAHAAGVIHRDLKPDNIFLEAGPGGEVVKVLDFGIAKASDSAGASDARLTFAGGLVGTPHYMSPEQCQGATVDARSDLYSLGCVVYELVTGRPPFLGDSAAALVAQHLWKLPEPPGRYAPDLPAAFEAALLRALAKRPEERVQTTAEFIEALTRACRVPETLVLGEQGQPAAAGDPRYVPTAQYAPDEPTADLNNLPHQVTSFVGREHEVGEVVRELLRQDVRLLTLTGAGGTGKTRLALEAARQLLGEFPDGVFFVDLSPLRDPALVAATIAQELRVKEVGGVSLGGSLTEFLRDRRLLLVLDNFEHLLGAAPMVTRLLEAAPRLRVLVTSQALLRVRAEREYRVEPLGLPSAARMPPLEEIERTPAVALFVERARQAKPAFALTAENAGAVVEICRRLDGLPLALELAAARVKLLPPQALLARLEHQLKLLVGGARDLPTRQQTMRGAIAWSYDLLEEAERGLLRRLAVFAGGATLSAAEAVCGEGGGMREEGGGGAGPWVLGSGLEDSGANASAPRYPAPGTRHPAPPSLLPPASSLLPESVLDGLGSLVDKSLLRQREQADGEARFVMLGVVREFAMEQLEACGEAQAARRSHARYFLALAGEAEPELLSPRQTRWLARLEAEHDNLRAALAWLLEQNPDACLRLAMAVRTFWSTHGPITEGRRWLEAALERGRTAPALVRLKAVRGAGVLAFLQGDLAAARGYAEEELRIGRETGDARMIGWASLSLGIVASQQGDLPAARAYVEESLARGREVQDYSLIGNATNALGELAREAGTSAEARQLYEQALTLYKQVGDQVGVSVALTNLGAAAWEAGDLAGAGAAYREALAIAQAAGARDAIACCLEGLGAVAAGCGAWARAARLGGAAEALREALGTTPERLERRLHETWVRTLREALPAGELAWEWAQGRATGLEEATREALEEQDG